MLVGVDILSLLEIGVKKTENYICMMAGGLRSAMFHTA